MTTTKDKRKKEWVWVLPTRDMAKRALKRFEKEGVDYYEALKEECQKLFSKL